MKTLHVLCMVLMIVMMQHTCLAETKIIDQDNVKEWDAENQTITIFNESSKTKLMAVKLISTRPDLCTFTEIYEVSNFEAYTPDSKADFKARTNTVVGSGAVTNAEWFIEQNVSYVVNATDYGIKQANESIYNNKTGKNETVLVNKTVITGYHDETRYKVTWIDYQPYVKEMTKDQVQKIKIVYYKVPELGPFQIQTIPMFRGVECQELTWWSGSWDRRRPIHINNTVGDAVTDYQLISENLSSFNIDAPSSRIINKTSGSQESFWNETVDASGNLEYVWCNYSSLPTGNWINSTYCIYYQSTPVVSSVSDGDATFLQFTKDETTTYLKSLVTPTSSNLYYRTKFKNSGSPSNVIMGIGNTIDESDDQLKLQSYTGTNLRYATAVNEGNPTASNEAPHFSDDTYHIGELKLLTGASLHGYIDDNEISSGVTTNLPDETMGLWLWKISGTLIQDWAFIAKYTANEPEPWTVGAEEEYPTPTPTPTPVLTTSVSPTYYDELDLPLILYILMISMLYLLIAFRNGVATLELSLIYLIFAFIFLLFQTVTVSVNYIYLTLFLLLFLISIAGITKQGVD